MYYKNVAAAVVVYDITSAESFRNAQNWARELRARNDRKAVVALAGNKCDRADVRMVPWEVRRAAASGRARGAALTHGRRRRRRTGTRRRTG